MKNEAFQECPRFLKCSVNKCPLSPDYNFQDSVRADQETKCTLAKSIRSRIGAKYPNLPYGGLTRREYAGKKAWEDKPEEEREIIIEKGKKSLKALHSQNENDKRRVMFGGGSNEE